ncbi:hypothetical protein ACKFKG_29965 [Phormidesmis sp. 146-35]
MKHILLVALSAIAVVMPAAKIAKAGGTLDFSQATARREVMEPSREQSSSGILDFALPAGSRPEKSQPATIAAARPKEADLEAIAATDLFEGGSDSLVAKAVGSAEGTRTPDGGRTRAYYGHVDPGNGRWNQGSFSYQHGANSPEAADYQQLRRLQSQADLIRQKAGTNRLMLSLEAELNGIDLANQAPLAALDNGGYVDRLKQAYDRGFTGSDAVLQARVYSFINPRTNQWDAPGLGNTEASITHDQGRRLDAIAQALSAHRLAEKQAKPDTIAAKNFSKKEAKKSGSGSNSVEISKALVGHSSTSN